MSHSPMADRGTHIRRMSISLVGVLAFFVTFAGFQVTQDARLIASPDGPVIVKADAPTAVASQDVGRTLR